VNQLRCAIYSRYSTDKQNPLSIDDQIRKCREYAQAKGWVVLESHIYSDEAVSGATDDRSGLQRLLEAATASVKPIDAILVDDTSRLSRKLADSLRIFDQLRFSGVRLVFVSQGIDTDSEQAEVLLATHGIVDSLYIRELAKKTHRGVEGRALQGLHTGGRCFGYRGAPIEDPTRTDSYGRPQILGVKLEIHPEQAAVVARIFTDYAAGDSITTIAKKLNAEGVASPAPYRGQRHPSWAPSAISVMLHNERYRGVAIWNRTRKVRDPKDRAPHSAASSALRVDGCGIPASTNYFGRHLAMGSVAPGNRQRGVLERTRGRPLLAIVHSEIPFLRISEVRPVRIERGADIGPRWRWVGQVRLPASSKLGYTFERLSGSPRFHRAGDRRRASARSSEG
jgi:DNA invertase Pin-like site-specific DNA recombinase